MFLFKEPPKSIVLEGIEYPLDTDFRIWIKFEKIITAKESDKEKALKLVKFITELNLPTIQETLDEIINFFTGEEEQIPLNNSTNKISNNTKYFDFEQDSIYIYSAFLSQYGIDLTTVSLHWWNFKALFQTLNSDCQFCKIIHYRSVNLKDVPKEQKKFYQEMKQKFKLIDSEKKEIITAEQFHNDLKLKINKRFDDIKKLAQKK